MKPGYRTTEFYVALFSQLLGLLALAGLVSPIERDALNAALAQAVTAAATLAASAAVVMQYIQCRTELKELQEDRPA